MHNVSGYLLDGKEPERVALRLLERDYTYGELRNAVSAIAAYLDLMAATKGDRVILAGENSFFWVAAYLGTLRAGLVCVPLPPGMPQQEFDYIARVTGAKFLFADPAFPARNKSCMHGLHLVTDGEAQAAAGAASQRSFHDLPAADWSDCASLAEVNPDDLAALMFTSGSTGMPRGVMVSHRNIMANTDSIVQYLCLSKNDRIMAVLPFHYCFGTSLLHTHLRVGGSLVIETRFVYPELVLQRMIDTRCTGFAGVPSHFQILLRRSSLREKRFPCLRYVQQAGGHLAPVFIRELREALPETQIFVMYGQTEATARLSYVPPAMLEQKMGSIGKGIPGVKMRVLNDAGEQVHPGEVGEIVAEGENVAAGYWRAPEESAITFRGGKLYTGDLGEVDEDGFIYVVGRCKDFLKCGGKRVSCRQVEEQLLGFDGLLETAVVGVADQILGEAVRAYVVPRNGDADGIEERLVMFCRQHMPPQLVPREIVVLRSLPKNSAGKVLKQGLR